MNLPATKTATALVPAPRHRATTLNRLLAPFFDKIRIDEEDARRLRSAHEKGIVVHVLRASRAMDPLYILYALERLGLPAPAWLHDHFAAKNTDKVAELVSTVEAERTALLFLRRPKTLINPNASYTQRYVEGLLALQRKTDRPILLLPETLNWEKRAVGLRRTIIDSIFGDRDAPGRMREILGFFWHHRSSRFHVGAPVDLAAVLEREKGQRDEVVAKKIRWAILHHLTREEQIRTGPVHRSAARTRQNVLNDGAVRRFLAEKGKQGESGDLEKRADEILRTIAADMRYGWLRVLDAIIDVIWHRIYDGIVVDEAGLAAVRRAARKGPVVLVPSHKSHVDYLVLSQVFFKDGMMPPHIAAGDNLNFWPIGHIFRRSGAFFIRRSFKGDKLYTILFGAYVRRLLKEGHAVEFFIEGGRSRTGKLLVPKMGMLSMCADPVLEGSINDVSFIPVSIGYEKVVEAKSYAKELHGHSKKKEAVTGLLSSTRVLASKYGRVYVDFAEPISLRVFAAARGYEIKRDENEAPRRHIVGQLGHRIVYGINEITRVTPTSIAALVLLGGAQRGVAEEDLYAGADRIIDFLEDRKARLSEVLAKNTRRAALREALGRFASEGLVVMTPAPDGATIFQVNDAGRLALDYYKNNILHFFVPYAVVAMTVLASADGPVSVEDARAGARELSHLLKHEFSFRVDRGFDDNFEEALAGLVARRTIVRTDGGALSVTSNGRTEARSLAGLLAVFLEAYRLVAETLAELSEPTPEKQFLARALARGGRQLLEGRIARAEAVSQPLMQSGLALLREDGIADKSGHITELDAAARKALVSRIGALLAAISGAA